MIIHLISKNMTALHKCIRHSQYFHYFWKPLDVTSASLLSSSTMWTVNLAQSLHPCWVLKQKYWPLMTAVVSYLCEVKADQWHPELSGTHLFSVLSPCILSNYLRTQKKNSTGFYCERPVIKSKKDTSWSAVPFFKITEGFRRSLGYRVRGDTHEDCGWSVPGQHGAWHWELCFSQCTSWLLPHPPCHTWFSEADAGSGQLRGRFQLPVCADMWFYWKNQKLCEVEERGVTRLDMWGTP